MTINNISSIMCVLAFKESLLLMRSNFKQKEEEIRKITEQTIERHIFDRKIYNHKLARGLHKILRDDIGFGLRIILKKYALGVFIMLMEKGT